jgi:hypothetical protein
LNNKPERRGELMEFFPGYLAFVTIPRKELQAVFNVVSKYGINE